MNQPHKMTPKSWSCSCTVGSAECSNCSCVEEPKDFEWSFEAPAVGSEVSVHLSNNGRDIKFHPSISLGTVGLRGGKPLVPGRHYLWEIKMLSNVYGTDVMVGIGTSKVDLNEHNREFRSLLGSTGESWGFSYKGRIRHNGLWEEYGCTFEEGSIIGVHLDLWCGVLEFYVNKKYLGVAFHLQPQVLFPMVSSTAANSAMQLVSCSSWASSLQFYCLRSLRSKPDILEQLISIPGFKAEWGTTCWWLLVKGDLKKDENRSQGDEHQVGNNSSRKNRLLIDLSSSSEESSSKYERHRKTKSTRRKCRRRVLSK